MSKEVAPYRNRPHLDRLKAYASYQFKDIELLPFGFCIDLITISFLKDGMHIIDFTKAGKLFEIIVPTPDTGVGMLQVMKNHCGAEKINARLVNQISII